jgi:hypothetical protein
MKKLNMYDALSLLVIVIFIGVLLSRVDIFPVFVDIYYHMSVALSFDKAGGIVLWDFWEFAPEGRPHLYPPFLHCVMLFLSEFFGNITVGKFISFAMFPASQVTVWAFAREIYSRKTAFYSVVVLSSCVEYFRLQAVTSAAALVLVLIPLVFFAFEKKKYIASTILLSLCLYTHVGMGPIAACAFLLYGVLYREKIKKAAQVIAASFVLYAPWGIHELMNMESLAANSPPSSGTLVVFPWVLGILGIILCLKRRKEFLIPICIFVCMIPIASSYMGRFTGHVVLPLAVLSGITLSYVDEKIAGNKRAVFVIGTLLVLSLVAPTVGMQQQGRGIQPPDRSGIQGGIVQRVALRGEIQRGAPQQPMREQRLLVKFRSLMTSLLVMRSDSYLTADNLKMVDIITRKSRENEIVFIPGGIMGCFVTATTGRPQMFGMWTEVEADYEPDPRAASVFVLPRERRAVEGLVKVGETERWVVYRAPHREPVNIPDAVVGKGIVYIVLMVALVGLLYDFLRK